MEIYMTTFIGKDNHLLAAPVHYIGTYISSSLSYFMSHWFDGRHFRRSAFCMDDVLLVLWSWGTGSGNFRGGCLVICFRFRYSRCFFRCLCDSLLLVMMRWKSTRLSSPSKDGVSL